LRKDDIVVNALAFSPDGRRLAVALRDGNISLCEAATGVEERQFLGSVLALAFSPDSKWLLTGGSDDTVRVWEAATGVEVLRRNGHEGGVLYVAFGGGGRTALSSGRDGQAYLWDLRPAPGPNVPLAELWANLAGDAPKAYRAVWALSERDGAASLFREKIAPVPPVEPARVKKWIADLNSAQFKVRAEAARALAGLDELAAPAMEAALKKKPALEVEQRLRKLLAALKRVPTPEELRRRRAVQALELAGTPEARSVLREWAGGAPGARLTEDARSALARLVEQGAARR
jgi:hypothetical protein